MTTPAVSVVVPTRNRSHLLPRLIECLEQQRGVDGIEVLVVDDSSIDDTARTLADLGRRDTTIRSARTPRPSGSAAARNVGWRAASAPIVAFTDDDCRPSPDWLACLLEGMNGADVVQGRTLFDPAEANGRGPFSQVVAVERFSGQFETSNVAYRREVLEQLGGFDETFEGDSFGEDVDLGWRALEAGAKAAFAPAAVVVHDVKRAPAVAELRASLRDARRWRHIGRVLRDHPGYRAYRLHKDPFLAATHPPTLLALAGLALLALRPHRRLARVLAIALVVPWLRHRVVVEPRPGRRRHLPVVLPAAFVVDATETVAVTASGFRYRTLVL
jgi:glycosyltransferase involved in cell wall biosynthesis